MKSPQQIEVLANQVLNSLDGLKPVEVNDFLFAKIKHRMISRRKEAAAKHMQLMFRLTGVLLLFVCINLSSFYLLNKWQSRNNYVKPTSAKTPTGAAAISDELLPKTNSYSY